MEQVVPPVTGDELRYDNGDNLVRLALRRDLIDVVEQRLQQQPVGGIQDHQPYPLTLNLPSLSAIPRRMKTSFAVGRAVHSINCFL